MALSLRGEFHLSAMKARGHATVSSATGLLQRNHCKRRRSGAAWEWPAPPGMVAARRLSEEAPRTDRSALGDCIGTRRAPRPGGRERQRRGRRSVRRMMLGPCNQNPFSWIKWMICPERLGEVSVGLLSHSPGFQGGIPQAQSSHLVPLEK